MIASTYLSPLLLLLAPEPTRDCSHLSANEQGCQIQVDLTTRECKQVPAQFESVFITGAHNLKIVARVNDKEVNSQGPDKFPYTAGKWQITINDDTGEICTTEFELPPEKSAPSPQSPQPSLLDPAVAASASAARLQLPTLGITGHRGLKRSENDGRKRPAWGRRITLYFLPDARPAFPIPADLEETDILTLAVIVPAKSAVDVTATSCPELQLGRHRGSLMELHGGGTARGPNALAGENGWEIIRSGEFRCSEAFTATIKTHLVESTVAQEDIVLPLDKVFFLTVGVGLVFDLGRPTRTSLGERPDAGAPMGTQKYVAQSNDFTGLRPVITVGAHPCGANPRYWRPCDVFSPTLILDPTRIDEGFGLGLNLTAPWFGIILAANVYESEVLSEGSNVAIGDTWTTPGDVPTRRVFDRNSFGAFIGVSLTTDLFHAIVGKKK